VHILVTGAAGLIGKELSSLLVQLGHRVTGLVHSSAATADAVAVVKGDVSCSRLGLDGPAYAALAKDVDVVVHCASVTQFAAPRAFYARVNVEGTRNVAAFAARAGCPLLHVSTAYVFGARDGEIAEDAPLARQGFANPYEESKAAGEAVVEAARRRGVPVAIARPSIVTGHSQTGAIHQFCDVYQFLRLIALGEIRAVPASPEAALDLVPIDHVVQSLAALVERIDSAVGKNFHLVSGTAVPVRAIAAAIGAFPGLCEPRIELPNTFRLDRLPHRERRWHQHVTRAYAHYLQRNPRFRDDNLRAVTGLHAPPASAEYLKRLVDFCVAEGFFQPLKQAA
jgi:2-alkyl-3-oxoalkanoate reductase